MYQYFCFCLLANHSARQLFRKATISQCFYPQTFVRKAITNPQGYPQGCIRKVIRSAVHVISSRLSRHRQLGVWRCCLSIAFFPTFALTRAGPPFIILVQRSAVFYSDGHHGRSILLAFLHTHTETSPTATKTRTRFIARPCVGVCTLTHMPQHT